MMGHKVAAFHAGAHKIELPKGYSVEVKNVWCSESEKYFRS